MSLLSIMRKTHPREEERGHGEHEGEDNENFF